MGGGDNPGSPFIDVEAISSDEDEGSSGQNVANSKGWEFDKSFKFYNVSIFQAVRIRIREFSIWQNNSWLPCQIELNLKTLMMMMTPFCFRIVAVPFPPLKIWEWSQWQMIRVWTLNSTLKKPAKGELKFYLI